MMALQKGSSDIENAMRADGKTATHINGDFGTSR